MIESQKQNFTSLTLFATREKVRPMALLIFYNHGAAVLRLSALRRLSINLLRLR
uniref:Uncharacterized protein n=1 Tax=Manihot esculenta TaxID=3983 RepID=A0A2C9UNE5_MANES